MTDGGCLDCHGEVAEAGDGLHADLVRRCVECHLDHRGAGASITFAIDHDALEGNLSGRCEGCHEGDLEEEFGRRGHWDKGCGACHGTENWGRIRLDHREYFPLRTEGHWGLDCESCHPDSRAKGFEETTCSPGWGCHHPGTLEAWRSRGGDLGDHDEGHGEEEEEHREGHWGFSEFDDD